MTIRKEARSAGETRLVIDIRYRTADGRGHRYRPEPTVHTFEDILRHLRRVHIPRLKASTRRNYAQRLML